MNVRGHWTLAIVTATIVGSHPTAQDRPVFRAGVDVVTLHVTATDRARRYVTDLERTDFAVYEDGRKQELTFFQKTSLPVTVALLIDTSASMEESLPIAQEAAVGFVRGLSPADVASVIDFDSRVEVGQEFTTDRHALERAIQRTAAGGSTSLYSAVYTALNALRQTIDAPMDEPRRRAIVVLSDGEDTSSIVRLDTVLDLAARSDTVIYAIGLLGRETPGVRRSHEAPLVLQRFAQQTGGRAFIPVDARELAGIYGEIHAELSSQYSLAYESNNPRRDGQFRRIAIRIGRTGVVARARPGYYASTK
jgi:VWFA-related protein